MSAIQAAQRSYTITDPALPDNPIIFASKGFLDLSGYSLENILGRNCRFLQGNSTPPLNCHLTHFYHSLDFLFVLFFRYPIMTRFSPLHTLLTPFYTFLLFFSGPGTDFSQVAVLKEGIRAGVDTSVCLLNYRADGSPFFNQVGTSPQLCFSQHICTYQ